MNSKHRPYRPILTLMLTLASLCLQAQNFPIQATLQVTPPYSLYLQDYVGEQNRLSVMVFMKDLNRTDYRVRFRFSIEGNGLTLTTDPNYIPPPTILQGGIPMSISGPELADYFDPFHLVFTGTTRQEFQKTGRLPGGPYRMAVEVLDYNIGVPVSNPSYAITWAALNDPPLINLPMNNIKVQPNPQQNIIFQWTPRHTASPTAAFSTEYYFRMVEVWPVNRNPFDALNVGTPLFETTTTQTTLIYSLADPPLVPGRRYAFRVQARQMEDGVTRDMFKNNGYSEVFTFTYGDECKPPMDIGAESAYPDQMKINWAAATGNTEYVLLYKESGTAMEWHEENLFQTSKVIYGLKPGTSYDIQLAGRCGLYRSDPSTILTRATREKTTSSFECGKLPAAFNLDNKEPLEALNVGDMIQSGDFEIKITDVSGGNGTFTGKGSVVVPFLNYALVQVVFQSITINTNRQVIQGNITVTGIGL